MSKKTDEEISERPTEEATEKIVENKNMEWYNHWYSPPQEVLKSFNTGTFKGTDIKPQWRIKVLTEIFGPVGFGWYFELKDRWIEEYGSEVKVFVEVNLYIRDPVTKEWSKPIYGIGGNHIVNYRGRVSDEGYKMATTDAQSYAYQQLGIGGEIYMGVENTKYSNPEANEKPDCEAARYKGKPEPKKSEGGKKNKFGMDIGGLFGQSRETYIDLISSHYRNAEFRDDLKKFIIEKKKESYLELTDASLQEFFMGIPEKGNKK